MPIENRPAVGQQAVREKIESPAGGDFWIELPHRSGSCIARVGELRQSLLLLLFVHAFERRVGISNSPRTSNFSGKPAFFNFWGATYNGMLRMVRTLAVTSSPMVPSPRVMPSAEGSRLKTQRHRHSVQLQLANVVHLGCAGELVNPPLPIAQFGLAGSLRERQHGRRVRHAGELAAGFATDPLRRRVRRDQLWMFRFKRDQLVHEAIELGIADFRIIQYVVAVLVIADHVAKRLQLAREIFGAGRHFAIIGSIAAITAKRGARLVESSIRSKHLERTRRQVDSSRRSRPRAPGSLGRHGLCLHRRSHVRHAYRCHRLRLRLRSAKPSSALCTGRGRGSAAGSLVVYAIGYKGGEVMLKKRMGEARFNRITASFEKREFPLLTVISMLPPPTPFKLFVLSAGMAEMRPLRFVTAIVLGRFVRFTIESILVVRYGPHIIALLAEALRHHLSYVIAAVVAVAVIGWWIWRIKKAQRTRVA